MSNRLLEDLPPSFLWITKKVQDAPYAALKRADLHEALESQSALRPPSFVVQKAVTDFYATFQGHCHIQPLPATGAPLELHSTPFYTLSSSSSTLSSRGGGGAKPTATSSPSSSSAPSSSKYSSNTPQPPAMNHSVGTPSSQTPRGSSHHSTPTTTTSTTPTTTITAPPSRADGPSLLGAPSPIPSSGPPPEASLLSTPSSLLPTPQSLLSAPKMDDYRIYQLKQNEAQSKVCPYFGTPKGCRRGESCGLLHIPK